MSDKTLVLLGRILIAAIFIQSGYGKLMNIGGTAGWFGSIGLPVPVATAWVVALVELVGGIAVLVGFRTQIAAIVLALFTVASGFIAHFNFADQTQAIMFMKNLAIAGGFLFLAARGAGPWSLDARR